MFIRVNTWRYSIAALNGFSTLKVPSILCSGFARAICRQPKKPESAWNTCGVTAKRLMPFPSQKHFLHRQKDCATCYNGSIKVSSQQLLSAGPSPASLSPLIRSLPIFVFIRSLEGDQPCSFPRPASGAFYVSYSCCSCNRELHLPGHHYLDWIRPSLILCQYRV